MAHEISITPCTGLLRKSREAHLRSLANDLRKRFRFLGDFGAFYFLYVVREPVPDYEVWCASRDLTPMTAAK